MPDTYGQSKFEVMDLFTKRYSKTIREDDKDIAAKIGAEQWLEIIDHEARIRKKKLTLKQSVYILRLPSSTKKKYVKRL